MTYSALQILSTHTLPHGTRGLLVAAVIAGAVEEGGEDVEIIPHFGVVHPSHGAVQIDERTGLVQVSDQYGKGQDRRAGGPEDQEGVFVRGFAVHGRKRVMNGTAAPLQIMAMAAAMTMEHMPLEPESDFT